MWNSEGSEEGHETPGRHGCFACRRQGVAGDCVWLAKGQLILSFALLSIAGSLEQALELLLKQKAEPIDVSRSLS